MIQQTGLQSVPSLMGQAPPDQAPRDIETVAEELYALVTRDGGLDQHEQQILDGLFASLEEFAQGQSSQGGDPAQAGEEPQFESQDPGGQSQDAWASPDNQDVNYAS